MTDFAGLSGINDNLANSEIRTLKTGRNLWFVLAFLVFLFVIIFQTGLLLNPIGDLLGYSGCPNCGDNWLWKSNGNIPIGPTRSFDVNNVEHIICAEITYGIMICKECLAKPAELDEERIEQNLLSYPEGGWTLEKTAEVKQAVIRYKKEKLKNNSGNE